MKSVVTLLKNINDAFSTENALSSLELLCYHYNDFYNEKILEYLRGKNSIFYTDLFQYFIAESLNEEFRERIIWILKSSSNEIKSIIMNKCNDLSYHMKNNEISFDMQIMDMDLLKYTLSNPEFLDNIREILADIPTNIFYLRDKLEPEFTQEIADKLFDLFSKNSLYLIPIKYHSEKMLSTMIKNNDIDILFIDLDYRIEDLPEKVRFEYEIAYGGN